AAVRDALGDDAVVILHLDRGADLAGATWFFDRLRPLFADFDVIGLSYYPWWHGDLDAFAATLDGLATRYGLPLFVAETGYPWTLGFFDDTNNLVGLPGQLLPGFPASPQGQADFLAAVADRVAAVPGGLGVCYWAPDWIAAPEFGSAWENVALFDDAGRLLPGALVLGGTAVATESAAPQTWDLTVVAYPNPTVRTLTIEARDGADRCNHIEVVDRLGRRVAAAESACGGTPLRLDVADWAPGVYAVRLSSGDRHTAALFTVASR
ncbi:MAG: glycosyl hydrolase 53 family protein, partial [Bacteroidota bacterium]